MTEQVAEHTNGTIGALLNATFGNAPELLIATAALRSGFYRVVQLAMLGSMLTNLLFVFGISCLVGGLRWQVQELRITSGNVSVGMLLLSTAASLLPAALIMSGQLRSSSEKVVEGIPSKEELQFCRVNAFVMVIMYCCYLVFQLGTHTEEFDEDENVVDSAAGNQLHLAPHFTSRHGRQKHARRNLFCLKFMSFMGDESLIPTSFVEGDVEMSFQGTLRTSSSKDHDSNGNLNVVDIDQSHRRLARGDSEANYGGDEQSSYSSTSSPGEGRDLLSNNNKVEGSTMQGETLVANGYLASTYDSSESDALIDEESETAPTKKRITASRSRLRKARSERRKRLKNGADEIIRRRSREGVVESPSMEQGHCKYF